MDSFSRFAHGAAHAWAKQRLHFWARASQPLLRVCAIVALLWLGSAPLARAKATQPHPPNGKGCPARNTHLLDPVCFNNQIAVYPLAPTIRDVIDITPSGLWCTTCTPVYQFYQITQKLIKVYAATPNPPGTFCLGALTPWSFSFEVGPLAAGSYIVEVYIAITDGPTVLNATQVFTISAAPTYHWYSPLTLK